MDDEIIQNILFDERLDSYASFFDHGWVKEIVVGKLGRHAFAHNCWKTLPQLEGSIDDFIYALGIGS